MRVSRFRDDPGYIDDLDLLRRTHVFLDGVEQRGVNTADDEEGFVVRLKRDAEGNAMHDGANILEETLHGRVEIIQKPAI